MKNKFNFCHRLIERYLKVLLKISTQLCISISARS